MVIITGASKNIGRYLFSAFKDCGEQVIGTYNSTSDGFEDDKEDYYKVDISNHGEVKNWVASLRGLEHITLVCCAGMSQAGYAHKADIKVWQKVVEVNLFGTFNIVHELLPIMRNQSYGRIIMMSSVVAKYPTPGVSAYAASKGAMVSLAKTLAVENASKGITVNAINLGYVNIGMGVNDVPPIYQEKMKQAIPMGRFCTPQEIYNTVRYLMDTPYVNGAAIDINGGVI